MNFYLKKYGFCPPSINNPVNKNTGLIVVIPCYNETGLMTSLSAIYNCKKPNCSVEVITVINASERTHQQIKEQNLNTYKAGVKWAKEKNTEALKFHFILKNDLPKKHAGVGLARKIGMDEAVSRFHSIGIDGVIVCFDADSKCDSNYLVEIEKHFDKYPKTPGCSIRYEHPISGNEFDSNIYEGIVNYELFLRYYNQSLLYCGLPYAFQTVGSSMAVRSSAYQKQGGMNKRKAGEDFYFIHKIIALGHFSNLVTTKVIPSPRISDRVPFGTGKAIGDWVNSNLDTYTTYDVRVWQIIKDFVEMIPLLQKEDFEDTLFFKSANNNVFIDFLFANNFNDSLTEIRANSTNESAFIKRFFRWFNAFRVLKSVHHLRDHQYSNKPIFTEAKSMAKLLGFYKREKMVKELLISYRVVESVLVESG